MALGEFDLIARYFSDVGPADAALSAIGDDCATLRVPAGQQLQLSVDTFNADVHFPAAAPAAAIARRALGCSVSDLAAMGARPWCFTLALTLPLADEAWLAEFATGLNNAANAAGMRLIGGDTTAGPLAVSLQVMGLTAADTALARNAAQPGDALWLTGTTGLACAALACPELACPDSADSHWRPLLDAYYEPPLLTVFAQSLIGHARAAIDISDGLLADLAHLLEASNCGARLDIADLPLAPALIACRGDAQALQDALVGGDDYQLLFTTDATARDAIAQLADTHGVAVTCIGEITSGQGVTIGDAPDGFELPSITGYQHFQQDTQA